MGTYINTGNAGFQSARNSEYVDKSELISIVNGTLFTERRFSCVTRCRRFGKSLAAKMLCAYYDRSCDSRSLFSDLNITSNPQFEQHLNKYPVVYLDMSDFVTRFKDDSIIHHINEELIIDIHKAYPQVPIEDSDDLMAYLIRVRTVEQQPFFFIIDEWDAIYREFKSKTSVMDGYINWLRRMFKTYAANSVFAGVYMTGILPIKNYKTESALNNFTEYSMVEPRKMASHFGFTKDEVRTLATKYDMSFDLLEKWYDGYRIGDELSIFNPNSVMQALDTGRCRSFWASTGAYDAVSHYISMNFAGLKDDIIEMLAGGRCKVNPTKFQNDMSIINSKDDALTVLIHLGYLSYDWTKDECYIPNKEVAGEMQNAIEDNNWTTVIDAIKRSEQLLQDTLDGNEEAVAHGIEAVHDENTSILSYNNERLRVGERSSGMNSLACVLSLAYYAARNNYIVHRELPIGKGFADIVLIPRKNVESPAVVLELKYNQDAESAIDQIRDKNYPAKLQEYTNRLLLVGINYDRKTKRHTCRIERM